MTSEQSIHQSDNSAAAEGRRRAWERPSVRRLRAGQAELGANPANPELAFAYGS